MILTEDFGDARYHIKSYIPGEITINETKYTQSLIISAHKLITEWHPQHFEQLVADDFSIIIEQKPTILLLGTGQRFIMPQSSLLASLRQEHIGVECMDTKAACRTFIALVAEGRNVVAALLLE